MAMQTVETGRVLVKVGASSVEGVEELAAQAGDAVTNGLKALSFAETALVLSA
jgi:hypothetical protein